MNKIYKIGLIGCAGLGKSTIANEISKELDIIFLKSKDITRPILKKYNYDYEKCECVEKFLSKSEIEFEIVSNRTYQESLLTGGFVTDRTTLECFSYALLSVERYTDEEIKILERICRENMNKYTNLFYFSYKSGWFEQNGLRTINIYFQWKIDMLIRGLIKDWNINVNIIENQEQAKNIVNLLKN